MPLVNVENKQTIEQGTRIDYEDCSRVFHAVVVRCTVSLQNYIIPSRRCYITLEQSLFLGADPLKHTHRPCQVCANIEKAHLEKSVSHKNGSTRIGGGGV
jgi:hypothetical protein